MVSENRSPEIPSSRNKSIALSTTSMTSSSEPNIFVRGLPWATFLPQRRLIAAKVLLQDGLPAEQISARVGFGDYSSFYRAFKREYGISPAEYRRLQE